MTTVLYLSVATAAAVAAPVGPTAHPAVAPRAAVVAPLSAQAPSDFLLAGMGIAGLAIVAAGARRRQPGRRVAN